MDFSLFSGSGCETIEQKLEQNEKIIQIFSESLPHLNSSNANNNVNAYPISSGSVGGFVGSKLLINSSSNSSSMPLFPQLMLENQYQRQYQSSASSSSPSPATTPTTPNSTVTPILKLFAKQLLFLKPLNRVTHSHLFRRHPSLRIWLKLLNISSTTFDKLTESFNFHDLYDRNESELRTLLKTPSVNINDQDCFVVCNAFQNLKNCYKSLEKSIPPDLKLTSSDEATTPSLGFTATISSQASATPLTTAVASSPTSSTTTSSSSFLLNTSNSNESQLSSPSSSSISNTDLANRIRHQQHSQLGQMTTANLSELYSEALNSSFKKTLEQRKSESDAQYIGNQLLLSPNKSFITKSPNDQIQQQNNSVQVAKALTFSPTIPNKSSNKKSTGLKVTTPPPSRKNSTGSPFNNVINVNSQQIHAAALAAAAKLAAAQQAAKQTHNINESDTLLNTKSSNQNENNNPIMRSLSHESHLRNKISQPASASSPSNPTNQIANLPLSTETSSVCGEHNKLAVTPISDIMNANGIYESIRRSSIEGSDTSSRGPSGQASPIHAQSPTRIIKYTDEHYKNNNLSIPKSPKQYHDHRWKNTFKVANCGVCNKKLIIGIKCRACKFRCHKECEKKCLQPCSSSLISNFPQVSPSHTANTSPCESNFDLTNQSPQPQQQQSNQQTSPLSSNTSSTVQSPALAGNSCAQPTEELNHQQISWPSGASKMARVTNKIVQSFYSVSTPKQSQKQLLPIVSDPRNLPESRSDSSCNSSGPNSPNNYKNQQLQQQFSGRCFLNNNSQINNTQLNGNTDKKSTSSSSSISSQYNNNNNNSSQSNGKSVPLISQTLTPIQSTTNSLSPSQTAANPSSASKFLEFFPSTNPIITKTDESSNDAQTCEAFTDLRSDDKTTKEVRESLTLALKKVNNNNYSYSNKNKNLEIKDYGDSVKDHLAKSSMYENTEDDNNDTNDSESNQLNFSQDLKQFNITYEEITDKVEIGRGRFGTVFKAYWHGPHAIKEIDFDENLTESSEELRSFKEEVLNLRKTRHTNLILFVGACMKPPKCAILMSLCRGVSLHKYIHIDAYSKPTFDWTIDIATQIAQGMGYLHNKQMIHKDLRSKNIFIDGCKAVIADFGLYSITRLGKKLNDFKKRKDMLPVIKECVYYMAPELVRLLGKNEMESMFSQASDVFSFGTIWYELFCYEYPFSSHSTETVIYSIGNGLKNISPNIQIPKEFKTILLKCWSKDVSNRPDFSRLLETFRAIPKRSKLFRSPSHPGHIGRSLETLHTPMNDLKN